MSRLQNLLFVYLLWMQQTFLWAKLLLANYYILHSWFCSGVMASVEGDLQGQIGGIDHTSGVVASEKLGLIQRCYLGFNKMSWGLWLLNFLKLLGQTLNMAFSSNGLMFLRWLLTFLDILFLIEQSNMLGFHLITSLGRYKMIPVDLRRTIVLFQ